MTNICLTRKFPEHFYDVYNLKRGDYLNLWFRGRVLQHEQRFPGKSRKSKKDSFITTDEYWIYKKVDKETANHLYNRNYNPIEIYIHCPIGGKFTLTEDGQKLYDMTACIHSIDDSSYTIYFKQDIIENLEAKRLQVMEWINKYPVINGDVFLEFCVSVGGNRDDINYD